MLELPHDVTGLALNLESDNVGAVLFGDWEHIVEGDTVKRTGRQLEIPVGEGLLGRIVDPLGNPLDGKGDIETDRDAARRVQGPRRRPAPAGEGAAADRPQGDRRHDPDRPRPARADHRRPPDRQDGDRDRHDHQQQGLRTSSRSTSRSGSACRPSSGSPRRSRTRARSTTRSSSPPRPTRPRRSSSWRRTRAARWPSTSSTTASTRSCVYDDLTKHAYAYRQMSLLLRRPPGREAYPGDVFYLHSRLLERAVKLNDDLGGGSLTALPIIETQAGDVSAYIPTNVISITDGQIFLEPEPLLLGRAPGHQRRHLGVARRRQRADLADEEGGRQAQDRALPVPRPRGVRAVRLRPRRGHAAHAGPRRAAGEDAQPGRAPADGGRRPGRGALRRHQRLPRPHQRRPRRRVPPRAGRAAALVGLRDAREDRRRRLVGRDAEGARQGDRGVRRRLRLRPRRGGPAGGQRRRALGRREPVRRRRATDDERRATSAARKEPVGAGSRDE